MSALALIPAATASADPASQLEFLPDASPVAFGAVTVGQPSTRTVTVRNSSAAAANIFGLTFSGPDAGQFTPEMSTCGLTLAPSASCNFSIRFGPSSPGSFNAVLAVNYDGSSAPLTRPLSGSGAVPSLMLTPSALDFGTVLVDQHDEMNTITVQNTGDAPTRIDALEIDGPDASAFRVDFNTCQAQTLAVGAVCPVSVRFDPQEERTYDATLHARAGAASFSAALTGVGGVPNVVMTPNPLDFGSVEIGSSSTATVTANSIGNSPFQAIVTILTGDVGDLRVIKDSCSLREVFPGRSCTISVRFTPTTVGPVQAGLVVIGDGDPYLAMVRGAGIQSALPAAPPARGARVAFSRKSHAARIDRGRVRLGKARARALRPAP